MHRLLFSTVFVILLTGLVLSCTSSDAPAATPPPTVDLAPLQTEIDALGQRLTDTQRQQADDLSAYVRDTDSRLVALEEKPQPILPPPTDLTPLETAVSGLTYRLVVLENRPMPTPAPAADLTPLETAVDELVQAVCASDWKTTSLTVATYALWASVYLPELMPSEEVQSLLLTGPSDNYGGVQGGYGEICVLDADGRFSFKETP